MASRPRRRRRSASSTPRPARSSREAPECTRPQLDAAFEAAAKAQRDWKLDESLRRATLLTMADVLMGSGEVLSPILTAEQGKPLDQANIEVFGSAIWFQYYANLATPSR